MQPTSTQFSTPPGVQIRERGRHSAWTSVPAAGPAPPAASPHLSAAGMSQALQQVLHAVSVKSPAALVSLLCLCTCITTGSLFQRQRICSVLLQLILHTRLAEPKCLVAYRRNTSPVRPQAELRRPARPAICFSWLALTGADARPAATSHTI